jgi:hypothetical protein
VRVVNLLAYWQVLKAQRVIVLVGTAIAVLLAFMALVRVSPSGVAYRSPPTYVAGTTLFVTQPGFPWGRTVLNEYLKAQGGGPNAQPVSKFADPGRLSYLAAIYARLAGGDAVKKIIDPTGKKSLRYEVSQAVTSDGSVYPLINISAFSQTPSQAISLANRVAAALKTYVARNQTEGDIPAATRVSLPTVNRADRATVFQGVKFTAPLMLFVLAMALTIFAAFVRQNVQLGRSAQVHDGHAPPLTAVEPPDETDATGAEAADANDSRRRRHAGMGLRSEPAGPGGEELRVYADGEPGAASPRVRGGTLRIEKSNVSGRAH